MILTRLIVPLLCLALVLGVVAVNATIKCTPACPDVNTPAAKIHSTLDYCLKDFHSDCSSKKNYRCPPCENWRRFDQSGTPCPNQYHYSSVHGSAHPEWIIEPCFPVSGIENILDKTQAAKTNFLWGQEWSDAILGKDNRPQIQPTDLGLVMNSFYYRGQHQMHIHAAKLNNKFVNDCLRHLPASKNNWVSPTGNCDTSMVSKRVADLNTVNKLIIEGARNLSKVVGSVIDIKNIGALVSANPSGAGYAVTVFEGVTNHGDREILYYTP